MAEIYNSKNKLELEKFLNLVTERILEQNLSLFVGAGSSVQYGAMNWNELIDKIYNGSNNWNNTERAQYAELKGIDIKLEISNLISSVNIDYKRKNTFLYYLLGFDYKSIWTTNYDHVIEDVLKYKSKLYIPVFQYDHFKNLSYPNGNFLYKINGSYDKPKTIIITKNDFIDYRKSHEAYLILLKRELLCHSFLFIGCSFDDDILRICIKDILNCIENSSENYLTNHYAIIVESNKDKLNFISEDLRRNYNINCLLVENYNMSYEIAYGISSKVKYNSIFVSGSKLFSRHSKEEIAGKNVCKELVESFIDFDNPNFKFISGMGISIGHFISGTIKELCRNRNANTNRFLQMEPFPFKNKTSNKNHRKSIINLAGIFIFIYGDYNSKTDNPKTSGMWEEYLEAKKDKLSLIIPLPCGNDSISKVIFEEELKNINSFSYKNKDLIRTFNHNGTNKRFFNKLVNKVTVHAKKSTDKILEKLINDLELSDK